MTATKGIHIIWTTFGSWLPGDPSKPGHWSPLFDMYGRLSSQGNRLNLPNAATYEHAKRLQNEPTKSLTPNEIKMVANVIGKILTPNTKQPHQIAPGLPGNHHTAICTAAAINPTHIHMLLQPMQENISRFTGRIKGMTAAALLKHPNNRGRKHIWTAKYWKVFLFNDNAVAKVKSYIEKHNIENNIPPAPYPWIIQPQK